MVPVLQDWPGEGQGTKVLQITKPKYFQKMRNLHFYASLILSFICIAHKALNKLDDFGLTVAWKERQNYKIYEMQK